MKLWAGVLALLMSATAPAQARIWYDYQDYRGKDAGHWVFSLTSGKLPGSQLIKVHFHRIDGNGASGTISWGPYSIFHQDLTAPLDDKTKLRVQGLSVMPPVEDDHQTVVEVVGLPEGEYEIDWIHIELDNWTYGSIGYDAKFTPKTHFHVTAGRTEYFGNILVVATAGETPVRMMFGTVEEEGINHWALALTDETDRDIQIARSKAELGPIDRASQLDNLPAQPPTP